MFSGSSNKKTFFPKKKKIRYKTISFLAITEKDLFRVIVSFVYMESLRVFKIVVVGPSGSGKSSLLLRYSDDLFVDSYISTIGVDFKLKTVEHENEKIKLQLWDTAGQERFRTITSSFYRGAHCVVVVFDQSDHTSFAQLPQHIQDARRWTEERTPVFLVANKMDKISQVVEAQTKALAEEYNCYPCMSVSAKTGDNVDKVFENVTRVLWERSKRQRMIYDEKKKLPIGEEVDFNKKEKQCGSCWIL